MNEEFESESEIFDFDDLVVESSDVVVDQEYLSVDYTDYLTLQYAVLYDMRDTLHHIDTAIIVIMFCFLAVWLHLIVRRRGRRY